MSRPACCDGTCGACSRCLAGDEGLFVPQAKPRGPRPAALPARLVELRERARSGGLTDAEDTELDALEDTHAYLTAEDERRTARPARTAPAPVVALPALGTRLRVVRGAFAGRTGWVCEGHPSWDPPMVRVAWDPPFDGHGAMPLPLDELEVLP